MKRFSWGGFFAFVGAVFIAGLAANAQVPGVNSTLNSVFTLAYDNSTSKPSYSSSFVVVPAASATDVCVLHGSASKTMRVRRVILSGQTSVATADPVGIIKRSGPDLAGTATTITPVAYDTTFAAATGVTEAFTANPTTLGTVIGNIADPILFWGNLSTTAPIRYELNFGELASPIFLRGIGQNIAVNLNALTYLNGKLACTFEWTEDNDS